MKDKILKRSVCRTCGKVFDIIDLVTDVLFVLGAIAMFIFSAYIVKQVDAQGGRGSSEGEQWLKVASLLKTLGIVAIIVGALALGFTIVSLRLLKFSSSFAPMLTFGILNIITGVGIIVGIFMIIVAITECRGKKKQPNAAAK